MAYTTEQYTDKYTSPLDALLQEVLDFTLNEHSESHMVSGHVQGQLLRMLSRSLQPRRILEVGTFTGFSGLCLAEGLAPDGELHTLELREKDAATAQAYFNRSAYAHQIKLHVGNAAEIIPTLNQNWDLVFIDADKPGYITYYEQVLPRLNPNGVILADNVLFHGEVLQDEIKNKSAKAIAAFNEHVRNDERVEHVLLSVRDGVMMIKKAI